MREETIAKVPLVLLWPIRVWLRPFTKRSFNELCTTLFNLRYRAPDLQNLLYSAGRSRSPGVSPQAPASSQPGSSVFLGHPQRPDGLMLDASISGRVGGLLGFTCARRRNLRVTPAWGATKRQRVESPTEFRELQRNSIRKRETQPHKGHYHLFFRSLALALPSGIEPLSPP
ncbi:MAG: hypothetical protein QOJ58_903 [Alphaproteobacteria bacterium]|nr:hypothetical protein [Alphaproteobacteria bacterium]